MDGAAISAVAQGRLGHAADPSAEAYYPGLITRQSNPENLEFPFASLNSFHTPTEQFYVRTHFSVPALKAAEWSLRVEGHVEKPFEIGFDELRTFEPATSTALLECAGNGRIFLQPQQAGLRWEQGGVGNAEWTGVSLSRLLERAGVKSGALEVILEGHDQGKVGAPGPRRRHSIRPQHPARQGLPPGNVAGLADERRRPDPRTRLPGPGRHPRLVRHGVGQVAQAHCRHRTGRSTAISKPSATPSGNGTRTDLLRWSR